MSRLGRLLADDRRNLGLVAGVIGVTFLITLILPQLTTPPPRRPSGANSFSTDAIGHALLADYLDALGFKVGRIRREPRSDVVGGGLLVLAEPNIVKPGEGAAILEDLVENATPGRPLPLLLLVLPKRALSIEVDAHGRPLEVMSPMPLGDVTNVLRAFALLEVKRLGDSQSLVWNLLPSSCAPPILADTQLLDDNDPYLTPLIACEDGVLLGVYSGLSGDFLILSDPDLIADHGMGSHAENAELALEAIRSAAGPRDEIWFDELSHGHGIEGSFWRELLSYPLVLVVLHASLLILVMVWAAARNFGPRLPSAPAVPPGQGFLIGHVASVIRQGRHDGHLVERYLDDSLREVAARHHLDALAPGDLEPQLAKRSQARGLDFDPAAWRKLARKGRGSAVVAAREIQRWKKEMEHGSGSDPRSGLRRS